MEQLRKLMELVDKNVGTIPEGDYIEMCNSMKAIHDLVNEPRRLRYEPSIYLGYDTSVPMTNDALSGAPLDFYSQPYQSSDTDWATMESLMDEGHSIERAAELLIQDIMIDRGCLPGEAANYLIERGEEHVETIRLVASHLSATL
jgi:hypothetical protein